MPGTGLFDFDRGRVMRVMIIHSGKMLCIIFILVIAQSKDVRRIETDN